ncbi:MAG: glycosyltransferase [Thermoplasmata archaeon]
MRRPDPVPTRVLSGGVVAFNEERRIPAALDSLLHQPLPPGWRWGTVWVVASGCTDRTVEVTQEFARHDDRVRLIVEKKRGGKARALSEVFRRATGDALVLLNSDARAAPGAIAAILRNSDGHPGPFAIMGRPVPLPGGKGLVDCMVRMMWDLHDEFHREVLGLGEGTHLSDELLLLSLPLAAPLPDGIINDGSYIGAWLAGHQGQLLYAPEAVVETATPVCVRDHLHQRRRILAGHRQTARFLRISPSTLDRYALAHPRAGLRIVKRALARGDHPWSDLLLLSLGEVSAKALETWDRIPPKADHVRWRRIAENPAPERSRAFAPGSIDAVASSPTVPVTGTTEFLDRRVAALLHVSKEFGTGIPLGELSSLLPSEGPAELPELKRWLSTRPALASVEGDRVFPANAGPADLFERERRAAMYREAAERLVDRHLKPVLPWVRCVGITGSTAYGAPEAGDDLDLFVVTRTGSLWFFLAYTYLAVRVGFRPGPGTDRPPPCFNYVLEDREAETEFAAARGFLFAREALTARIFRGDDYYQDLLATAPWLGAEIPRLYARRSSGNPPEPEPPAPWPIRLANAFLFPPLATYLQLMGLRRNARGRAGSAEEGRFRTVIGRRRLAFVSDRFERLNDELSPASAHAREAPGVASPSRTTMAR